MKNQKKPDIMLKRFSIFCVITLASLAVKAGDVKVEKFKMAGPFKLSAPLQIDSMKHDSSRFDEKTLLDAAVNLDVLKSATATTDSLLPKNESEQHAIILLQTTFSNTRFLKAKVNINKLKNCKLYIDGKEKTAGTDISFLPAEHEIVIKLLQSPNAADTALVSLSSETAEYIMPPAETGQKLLSNDVVVKAKSTYYIKPSGDGLYYIQVNYQRFPDNVTEWTYQLKDAKTHRVILNTKNNISWVRNTPHTFKNIRDMKSGRKLILTDAQTLEETVACEKLPADYAEILPNLKQAILSKSDDGPKPDEDMHIYYHPDDRIPGWRGRNSLALFDMQTGMTTPLTFGNRNVYLQDVTADSKKALISVSTADITHMRPTDYSTLLQLDLETMAVDTLIAKDYFLGTCKYSPDGKMVAIQASPEFADRIGCTLPADKYPNMIENELYLLDIEKAKSVPCGSVAGSQPSVPCGSVAGSILPLTKAFNPSPQEFKWSTYDGNIYFSAEDGDCKSIFKLEFAIDKKTKAKNYADFKFVKLDIPETYVYHYDLADNAPFMGISACGSVTMGKTYLVNTKTMKVSMIEDIQQRELADYKMPTIHDFSYTNSEGYEIPGFYLLPPGVDEETAEKGKFPMLVYYYGGCSPTSRSFSTSYVFQVLASRGYVIYFLQPRGCTGYGQEYASWHGNTAGDPQTKDIIEGTKAFLNAHPFVNENKLGCFGASYGGFMTQYLLSKTDMFRCGWSHAGISNHASYWGFGYWGYTYSQTSMPGTYPWKDKQLYVDHSPLFNADKIKTPLLFTHGVDDRNVPPIESSQLFTALRLLGTPTAYVTFQKEGHHVQNYSRLMNWQHTFMAWFDKWLMDDDSWWNELYKEPELR